MSFNFLVRRQQSDDSGLAIVLPSPPNLSVCLVFWLNPTQCKPVTHFEDLFSRWGGVLHLTFFGSFVLPITTPVVFPSWPLALTLCRLSTRRLCDHHDVVLCRRWLSHRLETKIVPVVPIGQLHMLFNSAVLLQSRLLGPSDLFCAYSAL